MVLTIVYRKWTKKARKRRKHQKCFRLEALKSIYAWQPFLPFDLLFYNSLNQFLKILGYVKTMIYSMDSIVGIFHNKI